MPPELRVAHPSFRSSSLNTIWTPHPTLPLGRVGDHKSRLSLLSRFYRSFPQETRRARKSHSGPGILPRSYPRLGGEPEAAGTMDFFRCPSSQSQKTLLCSPV
jgi:hypothetical protein